ncbi:50S ribosomal protein L3 [bioreactor metagenome]|jgi:large subunit ribosomal protein L3|uniref:50S ribosomal protein L3 n=1 Tax=bioreactor metagenome TaxID=1076179 RepID=A0A645AN28_9ZZZZ
MTQVFDAQGRLTPVTVIKIEGNVVVTERTEEKNGYEATVLGTGDKKKSTITKPYAGQFKEVCEPKQHVIEFRDYEKEVKVGEVLGVDIFKDISFVDVTGTSKGKGYAGGMKRHGFGGGRATHGSKFHRDIGGTAMSSTPARTFKGTRMAGHMGNERTTVQNLKVVRVDEEMQVLMVKGAIPGPAQSVVIVKKAIKK